MAENSLIRDLLKSPAQLREERYAKLREGARSRAQLMGGGSATTGLPGLLTGLAQQSMVAQAPMAEQMVRRGMLGLSSIAGAFPQTATKTGSATMIAGDGQEVTRPVTREVPSLASNLKRELAIGSMSPEERMQVQTQGILQAGGTTDPDKLLTLAEQLRSAGRFDLAETFETRAKSLQNVNKKKEALRAVGNSIVKEAAETDDPKIRQRLLQINTLVQAGEMEPTDALNMMEDLRTGAEVDTTPPSKIELALVSGQIKSDSSLQKMINQMSTQPGWFFDSVDEDVAASIEGAVAWRSRQILDKGKGDVTPQQAVQQATKELFEEWQAKQKSKKPKQNPALKKQNVDMDQAVEGAAA